MSSGCSMKSVKANALIPIGIVGSNSSALLDWDWRCFNKKEEQSWKHVFMVFPSVMLKHFQLQSSNVNYYFHNTPRQCRVNFYPLFWTTVNLKSALYSTVHQYSCILLENNRRVLWFWSSVASFSHCIASLVLPIFFPSLPKVREPDTKFAHRDGACLLFSNFCLLSPKLKKVNTYRRL